MYCLNLSGRVGLPSQDGTMIAEDDVESSLMVVALAMVTTLRAEKNATRNVFVIFLKLKGVVLDTFHRGFIILKRENANNLFTEDVVVI